MSTRSALAIQTGDAWRGRYCHSDGYPSHQLVVLHALVARDGVDAVRTMLTETHTGWNFLSTDDAQLAKLGERDPAQIVPGYGLAPAITPGGYRRDEHWIESGGDDWGAEWAYLLGERDIAVLENTGSGWLIRGRAPYDEPLTKEWVTGLECGEHFERCVHYAWYHFKGVTDLTVGTRDYLATVTS